MLKVSQGVREVPIIVEDGKVTAPVKGATLIGNGPDALTKVTAVANDLALDEASHRAAQLLVLFGPTGVLAGEGHGRCHQISQRLGGFIGVPSAH